MTWITIGVVAFIAWCVLVAVSVNVFFSGHALTGFYLLALAYVLRSRK
jgi:hypothetical protein